MFPPERIVCLTEETVETLYLLGEESRIVGISGYVVRPPQARREKPRVSAFTSADIEKITALNLQLVLSFSDLQADMVVRRGIPVHASTSETLAKFSPATGCWARSSAPANAQRPSRHRTKRGFPKRGPARPPADRAYSSRSGTSR
jgi:hypothetical protein